MSGKLEPPAGTVVRYIEATLPPFRGPFLKIDRARMHFLELERTLSDYVDRAKPIWGWYYEPHYEHMKLWTLTLTEHPPETVPLMVGDIAHNLRSALDIMLCDIARLRNKSTDKIKFLFGIDKDDYQIRLRKSDLKRLGHDIVSELEELQPYRSGNAPLRSLHDLDILDKHEIVSPYLVSMNAERRTPTHDWFVATSEDMILVRHGMEMDILPKLHGEPFLTFRRNLPQGSPFAGHPVLETMSDTLGVVQQIVETFATKFSDGNESR